MNVLRFIGIQCTRLALKYLSEFTRPLYMSKEKIPHVEDFFNSRIRIATRSCYRATRNRVIPRFRTFRNKRRHVGHSIPKCRGGRSKIFTPHQPDNIYTLGGRRGIRTLDTFRYAAFPRRCTRPLCDPSSKDVLLNSRLVRGGLARRVLCLQSFQACPGFIPGTRALVPG